MAVGTIEKIQVILQAVIDGFAKGLGKAQSQLKSVGTQMQGLGNSLTMSMGKFRAVNKAVGMSVRDFKKFSKGLSPEVLKEFNLRMRKSGSFVDTHTGRIVSATKAQKRMTTQISSMGGKVGNTFRKLTHGMRGFRMEALGVMFFGMMLQRTFMGLLNPVMEAFGVFDMFRLMLLVLFLPIMEMIFPYILKFMEWFMDLPEPVKKAIGIFVLLALIFGTIIMVLGMFALGLGSLIQFFPIFGVAIKAIGGFLAGLSAAFLAFVAVVVAIVIGMYVAWKENFMGMKKIVKIFVDSIKQIFKGLIDMIVGFIKFVVAIFKGDWKSAMEHFKRYGEGMKNFFIGIFNAILSFCTMVFIGFVRVIKWAIDLVIGFFKWLYNKLVGGSIIPDLVRAIIDWFWKLPTAIFNMFKSIVSGMYNIGKDIIQKMINGVKSLGRKVIDAILGLFPKWMRDGIESAGKITINIVKSVTEKVKSVFGGGSQDDFIWRPGQGPISINPNDTLLGFKGAPPGIGGGSTVNQENNFYGFTMDDLKRYLDDRDRRLVDDIRRLTKQ